MRPSREPRMDATAPALPRRRILAVHCLASAGWGFSFALGVELGPVAGLLLYEVAPRCAFLLGGAVALVMAGLVAVALPPDEPVVEDDKGGGSLPLGAAVFGLGTAWLQAFLEGAMLTFL